MQPEERSLHLLLWAAAERRRLAIERAKKDHPTASHTRAEPSLEGRRARAGVLRPRSAILARRLATPAASSEQPSLPADRGLSLSTTRAGSEATVVVAGELDRHSAPFLAEELRELLAEGARRVTLDLAAMTFMDSSGIGILVSARMAARERGGQIVLLAIRSCVQRVLDVSGAARFFEVT